MGRTRGSEENIALDCRRQSRRISGSWVFCSGDSIAAVASMCARASKGPRRGDQFTLAVTPRFRISCWMSRARSTKGEFQSSPRGRDRRLTEFRESVQIMSERKAPRREERRRYRYARKRSRAHIILPSSALVAESRPSVHLPRQRGAAASKEARTIPKPAIPRDS